MVCEDSTRLVIRMDGWPGFFVVIIVAKEQQAKGVIPQRKLHKRHKGSLKK